MMLRLLGALGLIGAGVLLGRSTRETPAHRRPIPPEHKRTPSVRDAGPETMAAPPPRWDAVDQQADESFPASDPPGNY